MGDQVFRIFSTPVFKAELSKDVCKNTLDSIYKLKDSGSGQTSQLTWSSRDDLQTLSEFKEISNSITNKVKGILDYLNLVRDEEYITSMWSNINKLGQQHPQHTHSNSLFSGVVYLQAPEGSGRTYFVDPRPGAKVLSMDYNSPIAEWMTSNNWGHDAEEGTMLLFPSWLPHGVDYSDYDLDKERVSLSFNIMVKTDIQGETRKLSLK